MPNSTKIGIIIFIVLLLGFLLKFFGQTSKDRLADGEQMTSEGIVIGGSGSDDHLAEYDPKFIEDYNTALSKEDYVLAEELAANLVSKRSNDANALVGLGLPQLLQGKFEDAAVNFDKAIKLDPRNSVALYNRGFAAWQLGDSQTAMRFYRDALEITPDLPDAHFGMAAAAEKLDLNELVIKHASRFLQLKSEGAFVPDATKMLVTAKKKTKHPH
jgi:tetratricopeptide (TPR) repeat protein